MHSTLRTKIFETALTLAHSRGYQHVERKRIAQLVGCSEGVISYHFKSMVALRNAIVAHAIQKEDYRIIVQGYLARHSLVRKAPEALIRRALADIRQ